MPGDLSPALLQDAFARVFEESAYACLDPAQQPPPVAEPMLAATLDYDGPARGALWLAVPERLAVTLAAGMLGEEDGAVSPGAARDAVGELLNVIVGAVAVEAFGSDASCSFGTPRVERLDPAAHRAALAGLGILVTMVDERGSRVDLGSRGAEAER